jgi:uncharacterized membrane protein YdjX (TVP38/TMEM64 family)
MSFPADPHPATPAPTAGRRLVRMLPLALIALASLTVIALGWHKHLSLAGLVASRAAIDAVVRLHPLAALAGFAAAYALAVALSLPGAVFLTILGGAIFGAWVGGLAALVGAIAGATVIFLVARSALGEWFARRAGGHCARLASGFYADAFYYLLFLRLVPVFPFWLVNIVPALLGMRLDRFTLGTLIGIIPGCIVYSSVGASFGVLIDRGQAPDLGVIFQPRILLPLLGLAALSLVPVIYARLRDRKAR